MSSDNDGQEQSIARFIVLEEISLSTLHFYIDSHSIFLQVLNPRHELIQSAWSPLYSMTKLKSLGHNDCINPI